MPFELYFFSVDFRLFSTPSLGYTIVSNFGLCLGLLLLFGEVSLSTFLFLVSARFSIASVLLYLLDCWQFLAVKSNSRFLIAQLLSYFISCKSLSSSYCSLTVTK